MSTEYLNNKTFEAIIIQFQNAKRSQKRYHILKTDFDIQSEKLKNKNTIKNPLVLPESLQHESNINLHNSQAILAEAFYTLSKNIVRYAKFSNIDEDDAVQEGVLICFERVEKFDPTKGKAFNYMTTCILNHFRQLWRTAKNYNELKKKYSKIFQISIGLPLNIRKREKKRH